MEYSLNNVSHRYYCCCRISFYIFINKQLQTVFISSSWWVQESAGGFSLQVNIHPQCALVCFPLTGCLLGKMSAVHLQHIHFEITLKTQHGNGMFLQEQAAEQDVLYTYCINICYVFQCSVKALQCANRSAEHRVYSIWARLNLQSRQWIINKMSYWLIDL